MKKFHIRATLLILLSVLMRTELYAQRKDPAFNIHNSKQGYLITTQGDTLIGTVSRLELTFLQFKRKSGGKAEKFYSPQVKEFKKGDKIFATKELPHNSLPVFLEKIETGPISLYRYIVFDKTTNMVTLSDPRSTLNGAYIPPVHNLPYNDRNIIRVFASKNDGPLVEIEASKNNTTSRKQRNEAFEELINDDPEILQEFNSSFLNLVSLRSLIEKYNRKGVARN